MKQVLAVITLLAIAAAPLQTAAQCDQTFLDAIGGGNTWIFRQGLSLAGYADKLPSPEIGVTILVPNNKAWLSFLWRNGFLFGHLGDLGSKLLSIMTFHIVPTAVSPDVLAGPEGTMPTLYGLLSSQSADLKHYTNFADGQFLFQGPWDDRVAGVTGDDKIQVCNSWVYVVDEVLIPAYDLDGVQDVQIPDGVFGGSPSSPSPSPTPSPSPSPSPSSPSPAPSPGTSEAQPSPSPSPSSPPAAPAPPACDKTFAQVAGETSGLGLLQTVLSQGAYASALPSPGDSYTLFAPTDAAFFDLLKTFNLSVTDALQLGDKLTAVLLYHVVPGALTPEQLKAKTKLTTGLALKTDNGGYTVAVNAFGQNTTVSGNYPGNTAHISSNLAVCASQVYVIDKVLIPAGSLDAIPAVSGGLDPAVAAQAISEATGGASPSPAPAAAAPSPFPAPGATPTTVPAPSPAVEALSSPAPAPEAPQAPITQIQGVALGMGYYAGCNVQLSNSGGAAQTATTDASTGQFSFQCAAADCTGETLTLAAQGQPQGCADRITKLPPPFDIATPVNALPQGVSLAAISPLTTIIAAANAQALAAPTAAPTGRKLLAGGLASRSLHQRRALLQTGGLDFAIASDGDSGSSNVSTYYGDALAASLAGDLSAYDLLAKNQELLCTGSVGGSLLASLAGGGTSASSAAAAVFRQFAQDLLAGSAFDLTVNATMQQLLTDALATLTSGAPAAGVDAAAVTTAAADTITTINSLLQQAVTTAQQSGMSEPGKLVEVLARLSKVCQARVAPVAGQLGAGSLSVAAWQQQFSLSALTNLTISETLG